MEKVKNLFVTREEKLKACAAKIIAKETFAPGDLVIWKEGMKNRRFPAYAEAVVVTQVLAEPVIDNTERSSGTPTFREPLDVVIGWLDSDGDFIEFYLDGRRLTKAE
ncbi:hypothetical protein F3I62_19065 [Pseudomonas sp. R-28-1W-6]|uniref:hypothetical protein n=1 Tax=Pseudomonas sp. R-28-1W-6 TaxID=2650101 RepID=UPI00136624C4|nr:hypothetical protein [Pseudomonas sp. R-28-1W-6]MWV14207.1 hypothetical protein [Pseudomonas sp. R-28-1W-6]